MGHQRVAQIESQLQELKMQIQKESGVSDEPKKAKKAKKAKSDEPKKARKVSGYLLFSGDKRQEAKDALVANGNETPKPTEVMSQIAKMWRELDDDSKEPWDTKAKEMNEGSDGETSSA